MYTTQTCGVTVAQVILVHFVEVRILTGLPFFLPIFESNPCKKQGTALKNKFFLQFLFIFALFIFADAIISIMVALVKLLADQ